MSMPTRSNSRRLARLLTRVMMRPHAELASQQRREQVLLVVVDDADQDVAAADVLALEQLEVGAVAVQHQRVLQPARRCSSPRATSRSISVTSMPSRLRSSRSASCRPTSPPPTIVTRCRVDSVVPVIRRRTSAERLGRAHHENLVARLEHAAAARDEEVVAAPDRDDQRVVRQVQIGDAAEERRLRLEPVLDQPNRAVGERLGVECAGHADDALDVLGQLCFRPDHAVDAEAGEAARFVAGLEEVLARDEAERARAGELPRHGAADDVDLVEAGAGDEHVGSVRAGATQHVAAGAGPEHELHVERFEPIGDLGLVVDDEDFVLRGQPLGERKADLAAADDDDAHGGTIVDRARPGSTVRSSGARGFVSKIPPRRAAPSPSSERSERALEPQAKRAASPSRRRSRRAFKS